MTTKNNLSPEDALSKLKEAAAEYRAAKNQIESWSILRDEGPPSRPMERLALDQLSRSKDNEAARLRKATQRLITAALVVAGESEGC